MKKIIALVAILFSLMAFQEVQAKGVIIYHTGPTAEVIEKLPADFTLEEGGHVNLGVLYNQFGLFWLPVWNYGTPQYVLLSDNEDTYWDLSDEELSSLKTEYNLNIPDTPEPSLWNKIGLKPVILLLAIYFIWSAISNRNKKEETYS
jgi:hypothetical protein